MALTPNAQRKLDFAEDFSANSRNLPRADYALPAKADWNGLALIGEAPGAEEIRQNQPFVGRSGQLLNQVLAKAGIERSECLVANIFRFKPPANKVDHFFISKRAAETAGVEIDTSFGKFGSNWCRAEFSSEINNLKDLLSLWQPRLIIALGRTPLWALTGENALLNKVGERLDCRLLAGTPVLPTYHPSFILRGNWKLQDQWLEHFVAAQQF